MVTSRLTEEGAIKRARVLELRRQRWTFVDIAKELGISHQRAAQLYRSALAEFPVAELEEHRAEEQVLIDDAISNLMVIAKNPKAGPRAQIEAWNAIRGWAERKAKLLGLDAPERREVISIDQIDREIARLTAELTDRGEAVAAPATS